MCETENRKALQNLKNHSIKVFLKRKLDNYLRNRTSKNCGLWKTRTVGQ